MFNTKTMLRHPQKQAEQIQVDELQQASNELTELSDSELLEIVGGAVYQPVIECQELGDGSGWVSGTVV